MADEKKEKKTNKINLGLLQLEEQITLKTDEVRESTIFMNGEEIFTEIVYDEGRDKYRAAITKNSQKKSLSFFSSKKVAYKSIIVSIAGIYGVRIKNANLNMLEGF